MDITKAFNYVYWNSFEHNADFMATLEVSFKAGGVRQGDPLFPYLFIIYMDILTQLLNKPAAAGNFWNHPLCVCWCFADDLIIFFWSSLQGIQVMAELNKLSMLKVSYA